ncbi:ABC transporter permease [Falsiroseomonas ponticola]|uniref:ABC transporter permease n=1 Tax=Falsiroseomonas ponticola TaxID=2786951 RepID=UPI00299F4B31|nr:iron chelate uptake ABC transporter family permease subunit [Roseomonas ponticola]
MGARLIFAVLLLVMLAGASLFVSVGAVTPARLLAEGPEGPAMQLLLVSRLPRTIAVLLAGMAIGVAGLLMQLLARNRFVEPSTAGTAESASLGLLAVMVLAPEAPIFMKMLVAAGFALAGTALFLAILRQVPLRSVLMVPLLGLMLGGVIEAVTTFLAYRMDLLQSVNAWTAGDFSGVLEGRYELLWVAFALTVLAWFAADRFTVAGMGEDVATSLGLDHRRVLAMGLFIVAMVTATVVVTVGMVPFFGLVIPNLVAMAMGDHARRAIPWIAVLGGMLLLACDMLGRVIRFPYEIPVGTIVGVVGAALFLALLFRRQARLA